MKRLIVPLLAPLAACASLGAGAPSLPAAADVAAAHSQAIAEPCRQLIDQCGTIATPPEAISALSCRLRRDGSASCRFRVHRQPCTARLFRDRDRGWTARDFSRVPRRVHVRCRGTID